MNVSIAVVASIAALALVGCAGMAGPSEPTTPPAGLRVYTAGHSFHYWVADIVADMARGAGIQGHKVAGISCIGGSRVIQHWDVPDDKNDLKKALTAGTVDVLTLSPIWLPDEGIEKLARLAYEHNPNVRVTVQEFWLPNDEYLPLYPQPADHKVDHDAADLTLLRKHYAQYARDMDNVIRDVNKKLGKQVVFAVPAGDACDRLREKIVAGKASKLTKQSELFTDTWGHPSPVLEALAGYCHYAVIYRRSPVGLPMPQILAGNKNWNDEKLNRLLQELAWEAVRRHPLSGVK